MPEVTQIAAQLATAPAERGLTWLKTALQTAAQLEFATIPPYLCALWSIKSGDGRAYDHLREVVMEEMLHLGLVCNMLTTLGETPKLYPDAAPAYPCHLPGGVRPSLTVPLQGLTREGLEDVFMEIEKPHKDISGSDPTEETEPTIGEFYNAIRDALIALPAGSITGQKQLARKIWIRDDGNVSVEATLFKIQSVGDALKAIHVIKEQGEGSETSPLDSSKAMAWDLAHYFRFAELYHGKELALDPETGKYEYTGAEIPFPDTYPMAKVPPGGYQGPGLPPTVAANLVEFDQEYTTMLKQLHDAWKLGNMGKLNASVGTMGNLTSLAGEIIKVEIAPGGATYGPCFRIVPG